MRKAMIVLCALCLCGCSLKFGKNSADILRMPQKKGHASIEKLGFKGFQVDVVNSNSGFPKITLGAIEHNAVFLPMVNCVETYEEGIIVKRVCDVIPDVVIDARINPLGEGTVDNLATGEASLVYHAPDGDSGTYPIWIKAIESAVLQSDAEEETKQNWIEMLKEIGNGLSNR